MKTYVTEVRSNNYDVPYCCHAGYRIASGYTISGKYKRAYSKIWIAEANSPSDHEAAMCPCIPLRDSYDVTLERDTNWLMAHRKRMEAYFGELHEHRLCQMAVCRSLSEFEAFRHISIEDYCDIRIAHIAGLWVFNWGY